MRAALRLRACVPRLAAHAWFFRSHRTDIGRLVLDLAELARPGYASGAKMLGDIIERDSNDDSAWEMTMRVPMRFNRLVQRRPWLFIPPGKPSATPPANGRQVYLMFFGSARALPSRCPCGGSPEPLRFPRAGSGTRPI